MAPGEREEIEERDRLRVLQPNDPDSNYASRELVPSDTGISPTGADVAPGGRWRQSRSVAPPGANVGRRARNSGLGNMTIAS